MRAKSKQTGPNHLTVLHENAKSPLELCFMDLSGPMRIPAISPDGNEIYLYSLIIIDKWTCK